MALENLVESSDMYLSLLLSEYVQQNPTSTNTQLFSFLALLNAYIPEAYLLMAECQQILGPPDPIHGGPPFEERMEPFTVFINTSTPSPGCVCIDTVLAQRAVNLLANLRISRSTTVKKLMVSLCGREAQPHIVQFLKELLTKREFGKKGKEKFSRLIDDIRKEENFYNAVSILKTASDKLRQYSIYPQTLSRLFYIRGGIIDYGKAEKWAKIAIQRAPNTSYVADTLGQVYKNRFMREAKHLENILHMAQEAFQAFKDVETKAEKEEGPELKDTAGTVSISNNFNNRGLFGFIQVAKIASEKLNNVRSRSSKKLSFLQKLETEIEAKFDFFEWYLAYSKPDMTSVEPSYFWRDVALCYKLYTKKSPAESTSFPGLIDRPNRCLFTSKERRALFEQVEETVSDLEAIKDDLKTAYEANLDIGAAERYILSNIILSNKMHNSPQLTPVKELQAIIRRFLDTEVERRSPEFYLLVLLLFWPEEESHVVQEEDDEEDEEHAAEDDGSDDVTLEDKEQETTPDLVFDPDLQQYVTFMEKAFERAGYAKYLRGRYLLPLFFLGKGAGLSKWIHKSKLDAIVEKEVGAELCLEDDERTKEKWGWINKMWTNGDVWQVPEIQEMLLPVQVEPCHSPIMPQEHEEVLVCVGGKKIIAKTEVEPDASAQSPVLFYLGFTIQGPVVFSGRVSGQ